MNRYRCRALVLSSIDYGDADRIVTLLTDQNGRLAAFARGARKSRRRFAGALEPFTLLSVQMVQTRGDIFRLDEAQVLDGFGELRLEMGRIALAAYAAELVRECSREHEPQPGLFERLLMFFGALARQGAGNTELMRFELATLAVAGLMPRLDRCARCGEQVLAEAQFDSEHGGLLCMPCASHAGTDISREVAQALVSLQRPQASANPACELPRNVYAPARALLSGFIAHHLGRRLRSLDFMRQVGVDGW